MNWIELDQDFVTLKTKHWNAIIPLVRGRTEGDGVFSTEAKNPLKNLFNSLPKFASIALSFLCIGGVIAEAAAPEEFKPSTLLGIAQGVEVEGS